jgi:hypothetical protein
VCTPYAHPSQMRVLHPIHFHHPAPLRAYPSQMCAASGRLPGQGLATLRFATAPKQLQLHNGDRPLGRCGGWVPSTTPQGGTFGYTTDDIYFLEARQLESNLTLSIETLE